MAIWGGEYIHNVLGTISMHAHMLGWQTADKLAVTSWKGKTSQVSGSSCYVCRCLPFPNIHTQREIIFLEYLQVYYTYIYIRMHILLEKAPSVYLTISICVYVVQFPVFTF